MHILNFKRHYLAFRELIGLLTRHHHLLWEMSKREITDKYVGQVFGVFWAIGHPLILMGIYVFIFAIVFKVRIGGTRELPLDYTTYLLSGLIPWFAFQETMSKASTAITGNASLVKQVVFPIEILPIKGGLSSFLTQIVATLALISYIILTHRSLPWTYILLPVLFFLQILAMIGVSFILGSVGTYFRDVKDFVQVFCVAGMYVMPIFYLPKWVPQLFKPILYINPFSYLAWCYQDACYYGRFEHPWAWGIFAVLSVGIFHLGYLVFRKLKVIFGNVL